MELFVGREVLRAGSTSLRASFTDSPLGEYLGSCFVFGVCFGAVFLLVVFAVGATRYLPFFWSIACDAQRRHSTKTVTIVMMSTTWEQKKVHTLHMSKAVM